MQKQKYETPLTFRLIFTSCNGLIGGDITIKDEVLAIIKVIFEEIPKKTLVGTFREWMRRLEEVIKSGGEYRSLRGKASKFRYERKKIFKQLNQNTKFTVIICTVKVRFVKFFVPLVLFNEYYNYLKTNHQYLFK